MNDTEDKELNDIMLCYKAMGVSIDDSPAKIEMTYKLLTEENKKNLASSDPAVRENARSSMLLISEMYDKIKGSITYKAMSKEYLKAGEREISDGKRIVTPNGVVKKTNLMLCPKCNSAINKGSINCPICKSPIKGNSKKIANQFFTKTNIIITSMFLILGIIIIMNLMFPEQFIGLLNSLAILNR